jgi:glycosyltransferase involved in cell wall biosynthesis
VLTDRNPVALGDAIAGLLEDDDRRTRMAISGRARATANYHYPSLVNELVSWLQQRRP